MADDALAETGLAATRASTPHLAGGSSLGRYVIKSVLGSGGMGVVYRAHDPELGRMVALKVVRPSGDGTHSESRGRLVREAQAMARVAHPNVIVVHDAGTVGEEVFVAMELVDGESLDTWERAAKRTWRETLAVYLQAARGLAAAHAAGLVHRDFKPANTLVGRDGRVRVLDFGLARTVDDASPTAGTQPSDKAPMSLTQTGTIMGTPQFMSPEQHLGTTADARSDQFSFCVALYHAFYGAYPFPGSTFAQLAASVTEGDAAAPPRSSQVPSAFGKVLARGLRREPSDRFASVQALIDALEGAAPRKRWPLVAAAATALAIAAVTVALLMPRRTTTAAPIALAFTRNQQPITASGALVAMPDLTRDGKHLAYATETGISIRDLSTSVTKDIREWRTITDLRWSPAGDMILLATDRGAELVHPEGGEPTIFAWNAISCSAAWSPDGAEILAVCPDGLPWTVIQRATGAKRLLSLALPHDEVPRSFDWSVGGLAILTDAPSGSHIFVARPDGTSVRKIGDEGVATTVRWNAAGTRVYYVRQAERGSEIAYREVAAPEHPVVVLVQPQDVLAPGGTFALARDEKTLVYVTHQWTDDVQTRALDASAAVSLTADRQPKTALSLARDEKTIVFAAGDLTAKRLYQMPLAGGAPTDLGVPAADIRATVFSPHGDELAYSVDSLTAPELHVLNLSTHATRAIAVDPFDVNKLQWLESGQIMLLATDGKNVLAADPVAAKAQKLWPRELESGLWAPAFTPDGARLASTVALSEVASGIVELDPKSAEQRIIVPTSSALPLAWSIDGKWIIAQEIARDDQRLRVIAVDASGNGHSRLVMTEKDAMNPVFSRDERTVVWVHHVEPMDLWMATLDARPRLPAGPPAPPAALPQMPAIQASPQNLTVEGADGGVPAGWIAGGTPVAGRITSDCGRPGTCVVLDGASNGFIAQAIDAKPYRGKRVRITFDLRVRAGSCIVGVDSGIYASSEIASGQSMIGEQQWERREVMADIAPDAIYFEIKALAQGGGHAWIGGFTIEPLP